MGLWGFVALLIHAYFIAWINLGTFDSLMSKYSRSEATGNKRTFSARDLPIMC
jgi:hypothetical protein